MLCAFFIKKFLSLRSLHPNTFSPLLQFAAFAFAGLLLQARFTFSF
jgi:hypothetical protein